MAAEVIQLSDVRRERQLKDKPRMPFYGELLDELEQLNEKYTQVLEQNLELLYRLEQLP